MHDQNKIKSIKAMILILCLLLIFTGCARIFKRPQEEEKSKDEQKKDPPQALTQLEEETNTLIEEIEEVKEKRAKLLREEEQPSEEVKPEPQGQEESEAQETPMPAVNWVDFEKSVETLHNKWNSYEPKAKEDGAGDETIRGFETQLIALTEQVLARNENNTLVAANRLYGFLPEFLNLYKHQQPPDVKEVKYYTRQIMIHGEQKDWEETETMLQQMKKAWQTAKARMDKPDKNLNQRIDAALLDFDFVVRQQKIQLSRLKGNLLIENLDQIK